MASDLEKIGSESTSTGKWLRITSISRKNMVPVDSAREGQEHCQGGSGKATKSACRQLADSHWVGKTWAGA
ncbi:MAG: hypothetical protein LBU79_01850 [Planctomycetota bacterium]|nr:hypothetical protein [Planctomycetota bacterium]